jgi:hypothetical protein
MVVHDIVLIVIQELFRGIMNLDVLLSMNVLSHELKLDE